MLGLILLFHYLGLGGLILACLALGIWDLAMIDGMVFVLLFGMERILCAKRYTVPISVTVDKVPMERMPVEATITEPENPSEPETFPIAIAA